MGMNFQLEQIYNRNKFLMEWIYNQNEFIIIDTNIKRPRESHPNNISRMIVLI
jgi:hypothetical protein